jgi:hypothetical protein
VISKLKNRELLLEFSLILICMSLAWLLHQVVAYKMVVLNLFFLPVGLAAFFLGKYRAGVLAFLCVAAASMVVVFDVGDFAAFTSPLVVVLALMVWGAVLGLNTILIGTLSDERTKTIRELHDAYVGVVEVLSRYLNNADPLLNDRAYRVTELCQEVAAHMKLSQREMDDIRVASLLQDMENIEITAKVFQRAIGDLSLARGNSVREHTFHGADLVCSLSSVLTGALPLLTTDNEPLDGGRPTADAPFGARIIQAVRAYDRLRHNENCRMTHEQAIVELRSDPTGEYHPAVVDALAHAAPRASAGAPKSDAGAGEVSPGEEPKKLEAAELGA